MTSYPELTRTTVAKKLWFPQRTFRWPPPRLIQLGKLLHCWCSGHLWSAWLTDDYEGPMGWDEVGGEYPLTSRRADDGEFATRRCIKDCGTVQVRIPAHTISEV